MGIQLSAWWCKLVFIKNLDVITWFTRLTYCCVEVKWSVMDSDTESRQPRSVGCYRRRAYSIVSFELLLSSLVYCVETKLHLRSRCMIFKLWPRMKMICPVKKWSLRGARNEIIDQWCCWLSISITRLVHKVDQFVVCFRWTYDVRLSFIYHDMYSPDFLYLYPPLFRTAVFTHNRFPQEKVNVHKSCCRNQHDHLIMCCVHSNDKKSCIEYENYENLWK